MSTKLMSIVFILIASLIAAVPLAYAEPTAVKSTASTTSSVLAETKTVTLVVPDMTCPVCPITVKKALKNVNGVNKVTVDFDTKTAVVTFNPGLAKISDLTRATKKSGYPSSLKVDSK